MRATKRNNMKNGKKTIGISSDNICVFCEERQKLPQSEELVIMLENWLTERGY